MLNNREVRFSQPKLEIYGLFCSLCTLHLFLIGVCHLIIKTDARYIKGMLANPDIQPSASVNRWIVAILTFHFDLVHVKGTYYGLDGLFCCLAQPGDVPDEGEYAFEDWIDQMHGFVHIIQDLPAGEYFSMSSLTSSFIAAIPSVEIVTGTEDE